MMVETCSSGNGSSLLRKSIRSEALPSSPFDIGALREESEPESRAFITSTSLA
jgi:hypothetical protein